MRKGTNLAVSSKSTETLWKLCLSTKLPHQEIRWKFGTLRSSDTGTLRWRYQNLKEKLYLISPLCVLYSFSLCSWEYWFDWWYSLCMGVLCVSRYCVVKFVSLCEFEYWIEFEFWLKLFVSYISSSWDDGGGITVSVAGLICTSTLGTSFSCVIWLVVAVTTRCITTVDPEPKSK